MKIAIISDTHDHMENFHKALEVINKHKITTIIHCGDFCAPFMMEEFAKFKGDFHCVFGNIDDRHLTTKKATENNIKLHGDLAELIIDNKKIAVNHFPRIAEALAQAHIYDAVFYGHTHKKDKRILGKTLLLNPGELMGRFGKLSFAIYDAKTNDAEFVDVN